MKMLTPMQRVKIKEAQDIYDAFVPINLRAEQTVLSRLPNRAAYDAAVSWAFEPAEEHSEDSGGLYLYGKTGQGKTRTVSAILQRFITSHSCLDFQLWSFKALKQELAGISMSREAYKKDWLDDILDKLKSCEMLVLDDAFHVLSISFAEHLRDILEYHEAEIIITSNYSPRDLLSRWRDDAELHVLVQAIVRRLLDRCRFVNFDAVKPE